MRKEYEKVLKRIERLNDTQCRLVLKVIAQKIEKNLPCSTNSFIHALVVAENTRKDDLRSHF